MGEESFPQAEGAALAGLARAALAAEGRFRWPLWGNSMAPTLPADGEVEVAPLVGRPPTGALVVFIAGDRLVAHRLVCRRAGRWITQGDASPVPDPPLMPEQVIGMVTAAYRGGVRCWPGRAERWLAWFWAGRYYLLRMVRFGRRFRLRRQDVALDSGDTSPLSKAALERCNPKQRWRAAIESGVQTPQSKAALVRRNRKRHPDAAIQSGAGAPQSKAETA